MMAKAVELTVKITDVDEVKALMRQAAEEINRLRAGIAEIADDMAQRDEPTSRGYEIYADRLRTLLETSATQDGDQHS